MPTIPTIPEATLATRLGVARNDLKKIRAAHLMAGEDYLTSEKNNAVTITFSGEKKIRTRLGIPLPELAWNQNDAETRMHRGDPDAKAAIGGAQQPATLIVERRPHGNKIIVLCRTESGHPVRLRVRCNAHFVAGMRVPNCVHVELDRYDYNGRLPRRKGVL